MVDEGTTALTLAALATVVVGTAVGWRLPRTWLAVALLPAALAALPVLVTWLTLLVQGAARVVDLGEPFSLPLDVRLPSADAIANPALLVPCALALSALVWLAFRLPMSSLLVPAGAAVALSAVATLANHPVPLWSVVAALLVAAGVAAFRDRTLLGLLLTAALVAGLPNDALTVLTSGALVAASVAVLRLAGSPVERAVAALVLPAAVGGLLWSTGQVVDVDQSLRGVPVTLVVGVLALVLHRREVEISAAVTACLASAVAVVEATNEPGALALHLTLLGALVSSSALLHRDRRWAGWIGGALLAAATWVRLADLGVGTPEAYTLPSALALLAFGLHRLRRDPAAPTGPALSPGLLLATTPSLLWALGDPVSTRAALLGAGCLLLVLAGSRLRWNAPLVIGAAVGGVLVLRELAPYAAQTPQWVAIGLAGALLTLVGVTWERRLVELKQAAAYLDRLR